MGAMRDLQAKLWPEFIGEYPAIKAHAPARFKSLWDASLWPSVEEVEASWACELRYLPCPTEGPWRAWLEESAKSGQAELQDRLVAAARRLIARCSGDGKLYETVLSELQDVCDLVPDLDLMEDPIIRRAAQELRPLTTASIDTLRENKAARRDTAEAAKKIVKMLNLKG